MAYTEPDGLKIKQLSALSLQRLPLSLLKMSTTSETNNPQNGSDESQLQAGQTRSSGLPGPGASFQQSTTASRQLPPMGQLGAGLAHYGPPLEMGTNSEYS